MNDLLAVAPERRAAIARIADALRSVRRVAITTHINADGDAAGSVAALARLLPQLGVQATIVNPTPWPAIFGFLIEGLDDQSARGGAALREADALIAYLQMLGTQVDFKRYDNKANIR